MQSHQSTLCEENQSSRKLYPDIVEFDEVVDVSNGVAVAFAIVEFRSIVSVVVDSVVSIVVDSVVSVVTEVLLSKIFG